MLGIEEIEVQFLLFHSFQLIDWPGQTCKQLTLTGTIIEVQEKVCGCNLLFIAYLRAC